MKPALKHLIYKTLVFILFANFASAQKIEWGKMQLATSKNYYPSILSEDKDGIYTVASLKKAYVVEKYDRDKMTKKYATLVKVKGETYKDHKVRFEGVGDTKDKFLVFTSYFDKKKKKSTITGFAVDKKTGKKTGRQIELFEIAVEKKRRAGSFTVLKSRDGERLLIRHEAWYKKQKKYKVKYRLLDQDLNILLKRDEQYGKDAAYNSNNFIVDKDGSLYFTKQTGDNFSIASYDANQDYEKWEERLDTRKLGMDANAVITSLNFTINSENDLILTGYYSTNKRKKAGKKKVKAKDKNVLAGCFFLKMDGKSKEITVSKISQFDKKFKDQFKTKKDEKKGREANVKDEFKSTEILKKDDGGVILIGEKYQHFIYYDQDGNVVGETELFMDLVVINLSPEGELIWANRIPKLQKYSYNTQMYPLVFGSFGVSLFGWPMRIPEFFSFMAGMDEENLYVIFNDNPKNALSSNDIDKTIPLTKLSKAAPILFTMNLESGKKSEKLFMGGKDFQVHLKPKVAYQHDQKSPLVTFGKKGKKYKFGIMEF